MRIYNVNEYEASSILKPHPTLTFYFKYPCLFVLAVITFFDYLYFVNSNRMCSLSLHCRFAAPWTSNHKKPKVHVNSCKWNFVSVLLPAKKEISPKLPPHYQEQIKTEEPPDKQFWSLLLFFVFFLGYQKHSFFLSLSCRKLVKNIKLWLFLFGIKLHHKICLSNRSGKTAERQTQQCGSTGDRMTKQ